MNTTTTIFASGASRPADVRGFLEARHALGVAADEVSPAGERELVATAGSVAVFLDSGAFSEVDEIDGELVVARPISAEEWDERLALSERLAAELGSSLHVVAPDRVGSQEETLARLALYAPRVRRISELGARILVAIQRGDLDAPSFFAKVVSVLELEDLVPALPMKRGATPDDDVVRFVETVRPARLHLLGLGAVRGEDLLRRLEATSPSTEISLDSNLLRSKVGRTNGPGGGPRELTAVRDEIDDALLEDAFGETSREAFGDVAGVDYTDAISEPSGWITGAGLRRLAAELELEDAERRALLSDCDAWVGERLGDDPLLEVALDREWSTYHSRARAGERQRQAVRRVFSKPEPVVAAVPCQRWKERRSSFRPGGEVIDPSAYGVEVLDEATAKAFVVREHYSGSYPAARARIGLYRSRPFASPELVGVAVFSVPAQSKAIPKWIPAASAGVELGRFVLLDNVPGNGETWFLARAFRLLAEELPEVDAVLSYSDPLPRHTGDGEVVLPGHVGTIYQAFNGAYLGRSRRETHVLDPFGRVVSRRSLSKVRNEERGAGYAYRRLLESGAPERRAFESGPDYVARALAEGPFSRLRHPGNHVFAWGLNRGVRRTLESAAPYPKTVDAAPIWRAA